MPSSLSASPIFMMEPLPNCFSICCHAAASAFALLSSMGIPRKFVGIMAQGPKLEQKLQTAAETSHRPPQLDTVDIYSIWINGLLASCLLAVRHRPIRLHPGR